MKTAPALALAAALALPGAAMAQSQAAATLPNAFDPPAAARSAPTPAATPAPAPAEAADPQAVAAAETALKTTIAAAQSGTLNYDDMSPDLAEKVREQAAAVTPLIQSFGALQSVEHRGRENGAELFLVTFEKQATQWIIAQGEDGKIVALLFRPAPDA